MYNYEKMKEKVFTVEGFEKIDKIRKNVSGRQVVTVEEAMYGLLGDSWQSMACVDFLIEKGELEKILTSGPSQEHVLKVLIR